MLWGAGGLLELNNSCCRCDIPTEKRKQSARLKTCFPSLMHPAGPLPSISPSVLHRGIACSSDRVLMDFPYSCAFEGGREGPQDHRGTAARRRAPEALHSRVLPCPAPLSIGCCRRTRVEGPVFRLRRESAGNSCSSEEGHLGRLSQVTPWAGWDAEGGHCPEADPRLRLQERLRRAWEQPGSQRGWG